MSLLSRYSFSVKPQKTALIMAAMFRDGMFLAAQYAATLSGPLFFVGICFATAAPAVALLSLRILHKLAWLKVKAGVTIGITIALGYSLQTWGLRFIPSSKSASITAMYVPLVLLLQWLCLERIPGLMPYVGIVLAFIGLTFLVGSGGNLLVLNEGEWITLVGVVTIVAEIILVSARVGKVDTRRVTVVQLATASIAAFMAVGPVGETVPPMSTRLLVMALGLGVFSVTIQVTMNWAQRSVPPTRTAVIYADEPMWAGILGHLAGERLSLLALLDMASIVAGILVSELKFKKKKSFGQEVSPESL